MSDGRNKERKWLGLPQNSNQSLYDGWICSTSMGSCSYEMITRIIDLVDFGNHVWVRLGWGC